MTQKMKKSRGIAIAQKNESSRNFFQKTFILFAILAFTSFGFKARAQNEIDITVYNCSGCSWIINAYDASSNVIWTSPSITSTCSTVTYNCLNQGGGAAVLDHITVTGCGNVYPFGSGGVFSYSQNTSVCCGSSIDCAGGAGTNSSTFPCGPGTGTNLLIQMLP